LLPAWRTIAPGPMLLMIALSNMHNDLMAVVERLRVAPEEIQRRTRGIYSEVLQRSKHLDAGNFSVIHQDDLRRLFDGYDEEFFGGFCRAAAGPGGLQFRLSKRMTSSGGKTTRFKPRSREAHFEIAVSTTLLFQTFHDVERPISVAGIVCRDRLEALQRVIEHEIVHLIEMLLWTHSSCSARRFQSIARRAFAHVEHTHQLITPRERALRKFGIRPGDRVRFQLNGSPLVGVVNRITRRATVLVEDPRGMRYTDGKRYAKYYVPLAMLEPLASPART
jgi:hypothetical protein